MASWRRKRRANLTGSNLLYLFEEMQPASPFPGESGPRAWPAPPKVNSKGEREFQFRKATPKSKEEPNKSAYQRLQSSSNDQTNNAQAAKAVFENISELYPQETESVSTEVQDSEVEDSEDKSDSRDATPQQDNNPAKNSEPETSEKEKKSNASTIQLGKLFADDVCEDHPERLYNDMEPMIDRGKRLSEQVDLGPSLQELFSDDGDFMTPKTSIREEANAEEELLSFSFGGENSKESSHQVREALRKIAQSNSKSDEGTAATVDKQDEHLPTDDDDFELEVDGSDESPQLIVPVARKVLSGEHKKTDTDDTEQQEEDLENSSSQTGNSSSSSLGSEPVAKRALRRPMASRRKRMVNIPELNKQFLAMEEARSESMLGRPSGVTPRSGNEDIQELGPLGTVSRRGRTPKKGVIMRTVSQHRKIAGNRLAETGMIMSREELRSTRNRDIAKNPVPKSLRPLEFGGEDDEGMENVVTLTPASLEFPENRTEGGVRSKEKRSLFSLSSAKWSPRSGGFFQAEEKGSSSRFSEMGEGSGLMTRLSSGLKKAGMLFGRKSLTEFRGKGDIMVMGTLDETVCRICMVCRKKLGYRVYVRDSGRKIRVEGEEEGEGGEHVGATLMVGEMGGSDPMCAIVIRTSRTEGGRTSVAALSRFFQRLEKELGD